MNKITSADVSAWLKEQLTALHETHDYVAITLEINQFRDGSADAEQRVSIYTGRDKPGSKDKRSVEECIADMATQTPQSRADKLREQAAELLTKANEIEAQTETKP
jgi:hypothetical protein